MNKRKIITSILLVILMVCLQLPNAVYARQIEDMTGRQVEIPENIERIAGVGAGGLRLITFLQATDQIVGVEEFEKKDQKRPYIMAQQELLDLPSLGPRHGGDPELIIAQKPDVILASHITKKKANDLQLKTDIPVVVLNHGVLTKGQTYKYLYQALRLAGRVLDKEKRANKVINYIQKTVADLNKRTEEIPAAEKKKIYIGGMRFHGAHKNGVLSTDTSYRPFSFLNTENIASNLGSKYAAVNKEQFIVWNPSVVFIDAGGYPQVDLSKPEYTSLSAVQNKNLYLLSPVNYYNTNYSNELANAYYIGKVLYPEAFSDIKPARKADEIYKKLVGKPVYSEVKEVWGGYKQLSL